MKQITPIVLGLMLAACGGGNNSTSTPAQTDYRGFVLFEINNSAEDSEPADINNLDFSVAEDETQFDSVLN